MLVWMVGGVAAFTVLGFFILPPLVKHFAARAMSDALGRVVTIGKVEINPFALTAVVSDLSIAEAATPEAALSVGSLHVNLEAESILRGAPVLREIALHEPRFNVVRRDDGRYNWSDVIDRFAAQPASEGEARFSLNNIRITEGAVRFADEAAGVTHELAAIDLGVPFLSNLPVKIDLFVEPNFSAQLNGRPLSVAGRTRPFSFDRETVMDVVLDDLDVTPYVAYLPFDPAFKMPQGRISTRIELSFVQPESAEPRLVITGGLDLADVTLREKDGKPLIELPKVAIGFADVQPLAGLFHFDRLQIENPTIDVVLFESGKLNLLALSPPPATAAAATEQNDGAPVQTAQPRFRLDALKITGGKVRFEDRSAQKPFKTSLDMIELAVSSLGNGPDDRADVELDLVTDAGEKLSVRDSVKIAPFELDGRVSASGLLVPRYAPYYRSSLPGGEVATGRIDAVVKYGFKAGGETPEIEVLGESMLLRDFVLTLNGQKNPLLKLPSLSVTDLSVNPGARNVTIGGIESKGAAVSLVRQKNGELDAVSLTAESAEVSPDAGAEEPWSIALGRLAIDDAAVRLEDRVPAKAQVLRLDTLRVVAKDYSNAVGASTKLEIGTQVNGKGRIDVAGSVVAEPLAADLKVSARKLDLLISQPYLAKELKLTLKSGKLNSEGRLTIARASQAEIKGAFQGSLGIADFSVLDAANDAELVRWQALDFAKIDLKLAPFSISIDEIALSDFFTRLTLDEKGGLNLTQIRPAAADAASGESKVAEVTPPPAALPPISIGAIRVEKGNIEFSDRFIRPNYDANLTGLEGALIGLSSEPATLARLDLEGQIDNSAPLSVAGELNPFRQDRSLDISASVKDFELPAVSSYSGKYVGYGIAKGKLSAELGYKVQDRKLTATNRVFLDQLTFGEKVDSPDAVNLPVQLAVSLLKNARGEIDLNVPVSGSLDEPEFSVGGLVFKAIMNLVGKAITAPFALLGSLFGGEELSHLDFPAGRASLDEATQTKIATLARALNERPGLQLEITGQVDAASDTDGLKRLELERRVKAAKFKHMVAMGERVENIDAVPMGVDEYPAWLKRVYGDADFERPRNAIGLLRDIPAPEMEALLLKNITIDEEALRQLAQSRTRQVRKQLLDDGKIAPVRIFMLAPNINREGDSEAGRRTLFSVR